VASGQVAVRTRDSGDLGPKLLGEFIALAREAVEKRK
jgi:hypothetical protein